MSVQGGDTTRLLEAYTCMGGPSSQVAVPLTDPERPQERMRGPPTRVAAAAYDLMPREGSMALFG